MKLLINPTKKYNLFGYLITILVSRLSCQQILMMFLNFVFIQVKYFQLLNPNTISYYLFTYTLFVCQLNFFISMFSSSLKLEQSTPLYRLFYTTIWSVLFCFWAPLYSSCRGLQARWEDEGPQQVPGHFSTGHLSSRHLSTRHLSTSDTCLPRLFSTKYFCLPQILVHQDFSALSQKPNGWEPPPSKKNVHRTKNVHQIY